MSHGTWFALATSLYAMSSLLGCSSDETDDDGNTPNAGTAGSAGSSSAGTAGSAGTSGKGGSAGSGGAQGGSAGSGGTQGGAAGSGGTAGTNATGGTGAGGMNGGAGSGGTSGSAGSDAGTAGSAGAGEAGAATGEAGANGEGGGSGGDEGEMNFFVTSDTSPDADLGGIEGADARCQALADAAGHGEKIWVAYLSTEEPEVNARDRIGEGPYYNALGALIAEDKDALHARSGDAELFLDENGERINGQWEGSPDPNEHDILTGTEPDGTVAAGLTCGDWTSTTGDSRVGHSDGLGPNMNPNEPYSFWNGSHEGDCGDTAPGGGAGRIYCFVAP